MAMKFQVSLFCIVLFFQLACGTEQQVKEVAYQYPDYNPPTEAGISLGRQLFYDGGLSANGKVSCASCHQQTLAFTDGQALSHNGISRKALTRHTPSLINLADLDGLFWDGGVKNLESLSFAPITHADEMGSDLRVVLDYLQHHEQYPRQFQAAFGSDSITAALLGRALALFVRDIYQQISPTQFMALFDSLPEGHSLRHGLHIFKRKCANCHPLGNFTDGLYHNTGLDSLPYLPGPEKALLGRYRITYDSADLGHFKTPGLLNIAMTAPYMHDGRFQNLKAVLDHYDEGVIYTPYLDTLLYQRQGERIVTGIPMTETEKEHLMSFLITLSTKALLNDSKYGPPNP